MGTDVGRKERGSSIMRQPGLLTGAIPIRGTIVLLLLCLALPSAARVYKIVGPDGKIRYADSPPADGGAAKVTEVKIESYEGPAQIGTARTTPDWGAILRRPAASSGGSAAGSLVMFSTPTCGYCRKAKAYMNSKGIAYNEVDISKDAAGKEEYSRLGGRGVPFFVAGSRTMIGFSEEKLNSLLGLNP